MLLRAVSLTKRVGSENWYYRRSVPADVQRILRDSPQTSRPIGWYQTHISISLRTPDRATAKVRGAEVAADVERLFARLRDNASLVQDTFRLTYLAGAGNTLTGLAEAWRVAAIARRVRPRDAKRWAAVVIRFQKWLGHDDATRVTPEKVQAWGDERSKAGFRAKTINDTDFAALRAVFGWGSKRGWMSCNPAVAVRIEGRGEIDVREKYFLPDEAAGILQAALSIQTTVRQNPKTTAAMRWVPWLCAYSGARVMEMIQLRKQDVRHEREGWVMRITPEAGHVKTNRFRDVPVHEHLIALGFTAFVAAAEDGPLFCGLGKDGTTNGPASGTYKRILEQAREAVPAVQPNHAWRYTFKTYGYEAGMDQQTLDAICGHAAKTKGQDYTKVTLAKRRESMAKFPRYELLDRESSPETCAEAPL